MAARARPPWRQSLWREGLTAVEPALLALNGIKLARQPRGDGRTVLVLPGWRASDRSTLPLRRYLRSLNYDARGWGLGQNTGAVATFVRDLSVSVERLAATRGRPVPLVGWSLGGVVAREIARARPGIVEQVITLGTPIGGGPTHARNARPITVPITVIYSKTDAIVPWQASIDRTNPNVDHVEVRTTHLGLGIHHDVFVEVARRLSRPSVPPRSG